MRKRDLFRALALLMLLLTAACSSSKESVDEQGGAKVKVINRHWLSMEVYAEGTTQRVRLGRLQSGATKTFTLPGYLLVGATPMRFVMESSGPSPVILSENFVVVPGEEIVLVIPNTR